TLAAYPIGQAGPFGEELTIDVALAGPARAQRALVVSSGTHGIEGYFGSAAQLALLAQREYCAALAREVQLVLVHAINPYGFAYKRRVNEDNVDQNRNFVLDGRPFAGAPEAYRGLDGLLNPESPPSTFDPFLLRAGVATLRFGFLPLKNAIAQGQYEFARGLFFGGQAPSMSQRILREHVRSWVGQPERVLHVDLHTGLGKWATYALCTELPTDGSRVARLKREFGEAAVQGFDTKGVLYEIQGALGRWLEQCVEDAQYDCLLAEFGTYSSMRVLSAMRFENRVHHFGADRARLVAKARRVLLEAFCPSSAAWRRLVIERALGIMRQAGAALGARI
ncbi:MAG TPA: DUF2817 domain-containing protein, partial [Polyangiales bacterium]